MPNIQDVIDRFFIKGAFKRTLGYQPDLEHPRTFNEKLQVLKLTQRSPLLTQLSDKYAVREYVRAQAGEKYLNELYGVYDNVDQLKADLPNMPQSFVLKATHWSGGNFIIKNKDNFAIKPVISQLRSLLRRNYYYYTTRNYIPRLKGEWNYRDIPPRIICERYLEDSQGNLPDYKIFCFHGVPRVIEVDLDRFGTHTRAFYNTRWERQPYTIKYPSHSDQVKEPARLAEMLDIAARLSRHFIFCRVDLYNIDDERIYFGEITFYHDSGMGRFSPEHYDEQLGGLIELRE